MVARFKTWISSISIGDLAGWLAVGLIILFVLAANALVIPRAEENLTTTSGDKPRIKTDNTQQVTQPQAASPSLVPSVVPPKPVTTITPSTVLNLTNWKLTLPIDTSHAGSPDEIKQPELATFTLNPYFRLNSSKNGVIFRANVNGATTSGSQYPRSELREMTNSGKQNASWSNTIGTHTMTIRQAITHTPSVKPDVVAGQIHDASDDVVMVRLEGKRLFVESDGEAIGELDGNYSLGTVFTVQMLAAGGHIKVYYNGEQKVDFIKAGSGFYFKAGCYTQSNVSRGDAPDAYGEVVIYSLQVSHT